MIQIIADIQPFQIMQKVSVYQDGNEIDTAHTDIDKLVPVIKGLKNKYNIDNINLIGGNQYLSKFKKDLSTDFDITKINIITK